MIILRLLARTPGNSGLFAVKEPENQGQDDADEQAGRQRKVEAEILAFEGKIAGETAKPGKRTFAAHHEKKPDARHDQAHP